MPKPPQACHCRTRLGPPPLYRQEKSCKNHVVPTSDVAVEKTGRGGTSQKAALENPSMSRTVTFTTSPVRFCNCGVGAALCPCSRFPNESFNCPQPVQRGQALDFTWRSQDGHSREHGTFQEVQGHRQRQMGFGSSLWGRV